MSHIDATASGFHRFLGRRVARCSFVRRVVGVADPKEEQEEEDEGVVERDGTDEEQDAEDDCVDSAKVGAAGVFESDGCGVEVDGACGCD